MLPEKSSKKICNVLSDRAKLDKKINRIVQVEKKVGIFKKNTGFSPYFTSKTKPTDMCGVKVGPIFNKVIMIVLKEIVEYNLEDDPMIHVWKLQNQSILRIRKNFLMEMVTDL